MTAASIDLETLGTNIDSQIVQIGACVFDPAGTTVSSNTFSRSIALFANKHVNATPGTITFWLQQVADNPQMANVFNNTDAVSITGALCDLAKYLKDNNVTEVWANGTKFDLGMLEYQYKANDLDVPWYHNADRCMRTLRAYNPDHDYCVAEANKYPLPGLGAHDAVTDAVWQARYIQLALCSMKEQGLKFN